ncbi:iron ABC transporter permease [Herbaspirillum sp. LeCh32-8]|uniref:FecCD family ABC transporter permease n=1 Tax=Herbaspirillum sp. LeCh32-8 TaxID=2821356 RepID=UPI001AE3BBC5|nr:iron ABC transporter permease [Herbaspirillum sp. LeCh32-8]MBP0598077.1 iron ABC transporter permease [Herbaspirillum sp. LeCh32-8]
MQASDLYRAAGSSYRQRQRRHGWLLLAGAALCLCLLVLDIATGPSAIGLAEVVHTLLQPEAGDSATRTIVMSMRLPVALMALAVGAALGLGGAEMQTLLNNPLASPYTLGLAAAAGFGAALTLYFDGFGLPVLIAVPLGGFLFCMLAASLLFALAFVPRAGAHVLVLAGISLLFLFQAMLSLLQFISSPELSQQITFWLFGSLLRSTWHSLACLAAVLLACGTLLLRDAWKLTALNLGEERAASLGVDVRRLRLKTLSLVSLLTATAIGFVGVIGFIGLVSPHIARMLVGADQRFFLPLSMLCGAALLSAASVLSKILLPGAIFPIGIVTALVGVPFFFALIINGVRRHA